MKIEEAIEILEHKFDESCRNNLFQNAEKLDYEDALYTAITALRSMQETTKPGWISVKERLPDDKKDGETVLAIVSGKPLDKNRCLDITAGRRAKPFGPVS